MCQDMHFSQFFNSPLNLNPALTGMFNGDTRFHLNLRQQWENVPVNYRSADVGADFKIRNNKNANFLGIGGLINYDQAGDLNLDMTGINASIAYTYFSSPTFSISPAVNLSFAQRKFDPANVTTSNQWDGRAYNPSIPSENIGSDSRSYFDLGAGLNFKFQNAFRRVINFGASAYHLIKPAERFNPNADYDSPRPIRYSFYGMVQLPIANPFDLLLNGLYARQDAYSESVVNAQIKFYIDKNQTAALYLGAGYRLDDAWYPMIAIEMGPVYGSFSYDYNISDFEIATNGRGGPELSIRYIIAHIPQGVLKNCPLY